MHQVAEKVEALTELVHAPVEAPHGVRLSITEHLEAAFNITTIGDLGRNKYFLWARFDCQARRVAPTRNADKSRDA